MITGMDAPRIILHLDMDSFYASVEGRERPEIRGKPVVVGADPKGGHGRGVVSTASYEARKFGIRSGMPISRAYALCPGAVYLPPHFPLYRDVSRRVMEILVRYSGAIHQVSIDEAYLDITPVGSYAAARELALRIKEEIREKEQLTCSIGIGPSRIVAKIASDFRKPDGLTVVPPEEVAAFLAPLPAGKIPGIGKKTGIGLAGMGIGTIGDLVRADVQALQSGFGRWGLMMHELALGRDVRGEREGGVSRSVSRELTFEEDTADPAVLLQALDGMAGDLHATLGNEGLYFRTLTLKVRYTGFITKTWSRTLSHRANSLKAIRDIARELLAAAPGGNTVRLVGIRLSGLQERESAQRSIGEYLREDSGRDSGDR
jgi:DNA polymerase IV (DinB-like DNA polymerase)